MAVDAAVALVSLVQAKAQLKITASSEDSFIESLVNRESQKAASYCGRTFVQESFTEFYDGEGEDTIVVRNYPIASLTSLHDDVRRDFNSDTQISISDDVLVDNRAGIVRLWNNRSAFNKGKGNVRIAYTGGYVAGSNVPHDLQEAVLIMILHAYRRLYADQRIGLVSETIGDRNVTYSRSDIPAEAKVILDQYRYYGTANHGH